MNSIRRRLLVGIAGGATVLLGLAGIALFVHTRAILVADFDLALRAKATALMSLIKQDGGKVEIDFTGEFMPEFDHTEYFQLWLPDHTTLERSRSLGGVDLPARSGPLDHPALWDLQLPDGRSGRATGVRFVPAIDTESVVQTSSVGTVTLVVARERTGLNHTLAEFETALALVGAAFLVATALLVTVVIRKGLAPLARVGDQAATIEASSLHVRFPTDNLPAELRPICERLNDLLARLEAAFQRERRISADIAHELRTPIAELRTLAEVALKWPDDAGPAFRDTLAIAQRMETIVAGLLTLARCEEGKQPIALEPVAIGALVEELWAPLAERAQRSQLVMTRDIPSELGLTTDRALLRLILANLLTNAVEYTPVRGGVQISAAQRDGRLHLTVANTTGNLGVDDVPHLFERFWRKDPARTGGEHSGLGLSVARAGAAALGFDLVAEMREPGILRLMLSEIVTRS